MGGKKRGGNLGTDSKSWSTFQMMHKYSTEKQLLGMTDRAK